MAAATETGTRKLSSAVEMFGGHILDVVIDCYKSPHTTKN